MSQCIIVVGCKQSVVAFPAGRKMELPLDDQGKRQQKMAEPSSSSSPASTINKRSFDVFVSFRGQDTRKGFTSHLYNALCQRGIFTFIDSEDLEKGERIEELFNYIKASKIFVAVLSKEYTDSRWCLKEITKMVECGRLIIPIFFDVKPRDIRKQSGPFEAAFQGHENSNRVSKEELRKWKDALRAVAEISGYVLENDTNGNEAQLIQKVVQQISRKLNKTARPITEHLVGMDSHIDKVYSLLDLTDKEVKMIGIVGMGGVGKTTIATVVYNMLLSDFEDSSFISNVRENFKQHNGGVALQKRLIKDILKDKHHLADVEVGKSLIEERFCFKKVLVILDDADHTEQLEALAGQTDWFGLRSRIIITSRNSRVLLEHGVKEEHIYRPEVLDYENSIKLFNSYAFRGVQPTQSKHVELSKEVVKRTGGLPLALRVFGSHLWRRNIKEWEEFLQKLLQEPDDHVGGRLKISYDGLEQKVKQIFLDISSFLIGKKKEYATYMWEDCGLYPETAISELQERSLINVNERDEFEMHDLLRDMGRGIAQYGEHWQWSRLRNLGDLLQSLAYKDKPRMAEGIVARGCTKGLVDTPSVLSTQDFVDFSYLRLLHLYGFAFKGEFLCLLERLKWLRLEYCKLSFSVLQRIPKWPSGVSNLNAISVLELINVDDEDRILMELSSSNRKAFNALKVLHLQSWEMSRTPDFSKMKMIGLRKLTLRYCIKLTKVDGSIGSLKSLVHLELRDCYELRRLPESICMLMSLESLTLVRCKKLSSLPDSIGHLSNLRTLSILENYELKKLPDSMRTLDSLVELYIDYFARELGYGFDNTFNLVNLNSKLRIKDFQSFEWLAGLPNSNWEKVKELTIKDRRIQDLPPYLGRLTNLEALSISCSELRSLPEWLGQLGKLKSFKLHCWSLRALPEWLGQLQKLRSFKLHCDNLRALPEWLGQLQKLKSFELECDSLKALPECVGQLQKLKSFKLHCWSLRALPESLGQLQKLKSFELKCESLDSIGEGLLLASSVEELYISCGSIEALPVTVGSTLENLRILKLNCRALKHVPDWIASLGRLEELSLSGCTNICILPSSISNLVQLQELCLESSMNLKSLQPLPSSLHVLNARGCENLRTISDVSNLKSLRELMLGGCRSLEDFCGLESIAHNLETLEFPRPWGGLSVFSQLSPAFMTRVFKEAAFSSLNTLCVSASGKFQDQEPTDNHQPFWITFPKVGRGGKPPTLVNCEFVASRIRKRSIYISIMEEDGHAVYQCTTGNFNHRIGGEEIAGYSMEGCCLRMQVSASTLKLDQVSLDVRYT